MVDGANNQPRLMEVPEQSTPAFSAIQSAAGVTARFRGPRQRIRILIADPMAVTAELLRQALSAEPGCEISGCARNLAELAEALSEQPPDIVLIKDSEPRGTFLPVAILDAVHRLSPSTRSIVLSSDLDRQDVITYFHAQARGILPADLTDFATMCNCIHAVFGGQIWASSEYLAYLIESLSGAKPLHALDEKSAKALSAREQEVLKLLAEGRSNRSMAEALRLSEHTIKNHLFHIFYKLGVSSRTEAVLYAMKQGTFLDQRKAS